MPRLGKDLALHLGTELGTGLEFGGVTIELPIQLTNLKAWWDSRTADQMNAQGSVIQEWRSRAGSMGPVALSQATPAARPVYVPSVPQLGGKPGVRFDGVDDALEALTASDSTFLHAGTGSTMFVYLRMDSTGPAGQRLWSTCPGNPTDVGIQLAFASATAAAVRYCNGSGTYLNSATLATAGHVERDVPRWQAFSHGGGVRAAHAGGGAAISTNGDVGGQVGSASAPGTPLRIGGTGSTNALKGWVAQLLIYDRVLSASEVASLGAFFDSIYVETPQQIPGLKCWFDSRTAAQMTLIAANTVGEWRLRAGSMGGVALSQATAGSRPTYVASVAELGGRPAAQFLGTVTFLQAGLPESDWSFLHNGLGSTYFLVLRYDSTGPGTQFAIGTFSNNLANVGFIALNSGTTYTARISNGSGTVLNSLYTAAAGHFERDVSRWQALTHGAGVARDYAGGATVVVANDTVGQSASQAAPLYTLRMGGFASGGYPMKGYIAQALFWDRVLSAAEINSLAAWAAMEYGVAA